MAIVPRGWRGSVIRLATGVATALGLLAAMRTVTQADSIRVCIPDGCLVGTDLGGGVSAFLGIPYAAPPVGDLRFRPPVDPVPWIGDRSATAFGPACPRLNPDGTLNGREDCLTLDLWQPAEASSLHPVIVFIHPGLNSRGGARMGSAAYGNQAAFITTWDGQPWAARGIVFVSVEWRVNALGFLAHPALSAEDPHGSSGNYGILDQIAALRWVQRNILAFGGDPSNVTILGATGGAADVSVLVVSDLAKGLFSHAILESPIWSRFPTLQQAEDGVSAQIVGRVVVDGVACDAASDVPACLRRAPFADIVRAAPFGTPSTESEDYAPRIDGWVLYGDPVDLIEGDLAPSKAALIIGSTADEMNAHALASDIEQELLSQHATEAEYKAALDDRFGVALSPQILALYPASDFESSELVAQLGFSPAFAAMLRVWTESAVTCPVRALARRASTGGRPVYRYFFTHSIENDAIVAPLGAFDNQDNWFIFRATPYKYFASELTLAGTMQAYWVAFARTGNPNDSGDQPFWPPYERRQHSDAYLLIHNGDEVTAADGVRTDVCDFWNMVDRQLHGQE